MSEPASASAQVTTPAEANQNTDAQPTEGQTPPASTQNQPDAGAQSNPQGAQQNQSAKEPSQEGDKAVPEKYELKLPEGSLLDASHVDALSAYAKEMGLTQEQAQALLERESTARSSEAKRIQEDFQRQIEAWVEDLKADKEIGGEAFKENVELAHRALARFAPEQFLEELKTTGLGNHPGLVRTFIRIGKEMADDKLVTSGAQAPQSNLRHADVLYPSLAKKD